MRTLIGCAMRTLIGATMVSRGYDLRWYNKNMICDRLYYTNDMWMGVRSTTFIEYILKRELARKKRINYYVFGCFLPNASAECF